MLFRATENRKMENDYQPFIVILFYEEFIYLNNMQNSCWHIIVISNTCKGTIDNI